MTGTAVAKLEYLSQSIETAVEDVREGRFNIDVKTTRQRCAGMLIPAELTTPVEVDKAKEQYRIRVDAYRKNAADLRVKLMAAGITPLAVLPHKAWVELCKETRLLRMAPSDWNEVRVNSNYLDKLRRFNWVEKAVAVVAALLWYGSLTTLTVVYAHALLFKVNWASASIWNIGGFFLAVALIASYIGVDRWVRQRFTGLVFKWHLQKALARPWSELLWDLAGADGSLIGQGGPSVGVELPDPPVEVAQTLLKAKAASLHLRVAAEAGAIVMPGLVPVLAAWHHARLKSEEFHPLADMFADPIIYCIHKAGYDYDQDWSPVAILAQYGDFPIERQAIDRLVSSKRVI